MKIRSTSGKKERLLVWFGVSAFILNSVFRNSVMNYFHFSIPDINYICIFVAMYFLLLEKRGGYRISKRIAPVFFSVIIFAILVSISNIVGNNIKGIWVLAVSIIPGMLLILGNTKCDYIKVFSTFRIIYNVCVIPILLIGITDYFLGGVVNSFLAMRCSSADWANMIYVENQCFGFRMCTIIGSPLMNGFFALVLAIINSIYEKYMKSSRILGCFIYGISIVAIILTGSRAAFVLILLMLFVRSVSEGKNIKRILIVAIMIIASMIIVNTNLFQNTIGVRFENNWIKDSRFSLLGKALSGAYGRIHFFVSEGYSYSRSLTATNTTSFLNFEFPVLMFLFDYGIIATICYYIVFLYYPVRYLLIYRNYYILMVYLCIFVYLNLFNCLAQKYDFNIMLGFIVVIFTNMAKMLFYEKDTMQRNAA